ncbi:REP-associated tyrosine transposase [Marinomonas pollencensis]|uniref:REP element-mobilizing transposase RayT n=1 Tax=Marinomonas pollencensis TaxID=491954 RepID=A0A3E0DAC6_9GAMM|nr:transposase [Marinomonas pollencensis]REG79524.1 REP element-mobilizing transposase RayT [Marinomonas pollencensis]
MSWNDLRKGRYSQLQGEYFITFKTEANRKYFRDFKLACLFCQQIKINEMNHQCVWLAWVLMPDHFHGLVRLNSQVDLSVVVGSLKGRSAKTLNHSRKVKSKIWQTGFYDRALRSGDDRKNIARYIVANPLRKNLVSSVSFYSFWDSVYL